MQPFPRATRATGGRLGAPRCAGMQAHRQIVHRCRCLERTGGAALRAEENSGGAILQTSSGRW